MPTQTLPISEPALWQSDRIGDYPGLLSYIELGEQKVRMTFCWCPPTPPDQPFVMGSPPDEPERSDWENQRKVVIPEGFWLAQHPVNQKQWKAVMGDNPSKKAKGDQYPVDSVSWNDARKFCHNAGLRLPSEAEWEYACRAGNATPFAIGRGDSLNAQMANFNGNVPYGAGQDAFNWPYRKRTVSEGSFPPNDWGLHDMHGQLWEWCEDEIGGRARVVRGGSCYSDGWYARSAYRDGDDPDIFNVVIGFRPCPSSTRDQAKAGGRKRAAEWGRE